MNVARAKHNTETQPYAATSALAYDSSGLLASNAPDKCHTKKTATTTVYVDTRKNYSRRKIANAGKAK